MITPEYEKSAVIRGKVDLISVSLPKDIIICIEVSTINMYLSSAVIISVCRRVNSKINRLLILTNLTHYLQGRNSLVIPCKFDDESSLFNRDVHD